MIQACSDNRGNSLYAKPSMKDTIFCSNANNSPNWSLLERLLKCCLQLWRHFCQREGSAPELCSPRAKSRNFWNSGDRAVECTQRKISQAVSNGCHPSSFPASILKGFEKGRNHHWHVRVQDRTSVSLCQPRSLSIVLLFKDWNS